MHVLDPCILLYFQWFFLKLSCIGLHLGSKLSCKNPQNVLSCPELSYFLRKKKLYASCISMWLIPNFPDLDILLIIALRRQLRRVWIRYFYNHLHDILWLVDVLLNFLSPQAKRCGNIAYEHGIYNLPHELPNDLRLWKLGNIRKVSKPCIMIGQRPIALRRP